jgi:hypothetical protein
MVRIKELEQEIRDLNKRIENLQNPFEYDSSWD